MEKDGHCYCYMSFPMPNIANTISLLLCLYIPHPCLCYSSNSVFGVLCFFIVGFSELHKDMFLLLDVSGRLNKNKLFKNKISVNQEIKS